MGTEERKTDIGAEATQFNNSEDQRGLVVEDGPPV